MSHDKPLMFNKYINKIYSLIMNINVKNVVDKFFSNNDVTIEGQGPKTFNREGLSISLKTEPMT